MDAYDATTVVFSRIQSLDPENAARIMGLLLIQDHGDKEMIRLAFGPESLLHSVVLKARKDLSLLPPSPSVSPSPAAASPFLLSRQSSSSRLGAPQPLAVNSPSWAPPPPFSRSNSAVNGDVVDELVSPVNHSPSPFYNGDLIDELQLQDQLSFLNDNQGIFADECRSPNGDGFPFPYGMGWHRRSCSINDLCLGSDLSSPGIGWRPCHYFARGYCKNGSSCRFLHGLPDDDSAAGVKMNAAVEQQCHELLMRSKSQRLMASAAAFPFSPTGSMPPSPSSASNKCINFLLQQHQNDTQRAAAAAALMLGGDETHKFLGRSRMERGDFAGMVNPGSRQIYLTFPADSTFREEDVSNYFSIYGPVQDVRIPYQQKRMFGFVTFLYPETVKLILAKGNPHFVCDSRVLVKPYKEKGKVPDKKQQQQSERGDFSGCSTPTGMGMDFRDPFDLGGGSRMMYGGCSTQDLLLRRKLEEQQAAELQQAIELQGRRFMGLQLLDLKARNLPSSPSSNAMMMGSPAFSSTPSITITPPDGRSSGGSHDDSPPSDKSRSPAASSATTAALSAVAEHEFLQRAAVNGADKEESDREPSPNVDSDFQESGVDHNLPDSPFASPTKASFAPESFKSCFFPIARLSSSGHGEVGL